MDQSKKQTENLKSIVQMGLSIQAINIMLAFCIKNNKTEIIDKLKDLILTFEESLTDKEKAEVQNSMDQAIKERSDRLIEDLESSFDEEEIDQIITQLKNP